ncbi:hypothetical protein HOY80DRAFT_1006444, partial [Tuber brumale]
GRSFLEKLSGEIGNSLSQDQISEINSAIRTLEVFRFDCKLNGDLCQANQVMVSEEDYAEEQVERKQAIADRAALANEIIGREKVLKNYREEKAGLLQRIKELEEEMKEEEEIVTAYEVKRIGEVRSKEKLERLIEKANVRASKAV